MATDSTEGGASGGHPRELREELATLARSRSRLSVPLADLPLLRSLAGGPDADLDAVLATIESARSRLTSRESEAIGVLFSDSDERWSANLKERMTKAGGLVGVASYHTFRDRSRPEGSLYDQLLDVLGQAIAAGDPADAVAADATPGGISAGDTSTGEPVPAEGVELAEAEAEAERVSGGRGRAKLALFAVGVVVLALVGLGLQRLTADESAANVVEVEGEQINFGAPAEGCDIPIGGTMNPSGVPTALVNGIVDAVDQVGGIEATGCPLHSVETWSGLYLQEFAGGTGPAGWVIASVEGLAEGAPILWFEAALVSGLRHSVGGDLVALGGEPVGNEPWQGHPTMTLSKGGVVIAHELAGPAFWVPGPAVDLWREQGGPDGVLGLPMTDVNYIGGVPHQDYEGGFLEQRPPALVEMELIDDDALQAQLDALPRVADGILRTFDGTAWWIDTDGVRHWIPDGDTWVCLGGDDVVLDMEVDGWVIGAFPAGAPASC